MNLIIKLLVRGRTPIRRRFHGTILLAVVAALAGCSKSAGSSDTTPTVATPVISPSGGTYSSSQTVTITDSITGASIYYTTDGSTPTNASSIYSGPITVASSETISAIAEKSSYSNSAIVRAVYTINLPAVAVPTINVGGTIYNTTRSVTMSDTTSGAVIHYTLDGSTPTSSSSTYTSVLSLSSTATVEAIAIAAGYLDSSVTTASVSIPTTSPTPWDTATVAGQISYAEDIPLSDSALSGAGFLNVVTQGGVDNTGATDAACAIQTLLNNTTLTHNNEQYGNSAPWQDLILFFPNGTYLLSNSTCLPLVKNYSDGTPDYGMVFLGQSQSGVVFKLASNTLPSVKFTGNTTALSRTVSNVSSTYGLHVNQHLQGPALRAGTTIASIGTNSITLSISASLTATGSSINALTPVIFTQSSLQLVNGVEQQFGNQAYHNVLENLTIDTSASGNPGAIGISFLASNMGAIRNVTLLGDTTASVIGSGIDMTRGVFGPALIENVAVTGYNYGVDVAYNCCGITIEHVTFDNQLSGAIFNADNLVAANAIRIKSGRSSTAVINSTGNGMVNLANSRIDQTGSSLVSNSSTGAISIHNTTFASAQTNLGGSSGTVNGLLQAQTWKAGSDFLLPLMIDTPVLPYDSSSQWISPASGMSAQWTEEVSTPVDATAAINAALVCNGSTSTLYLPHGIWYISSPIRIPSWVDRVVGMNSTLRVLPSAASNFSSGTPMLEVLSNSPGSCPYAPTVVIERLAFDTTGASVSGLYSVQADAPADNMVARTVVIRDEYSVGLMQAHQAQGGGEMFLESTTGGPLRLNGTNYVLSRQFNSEGGTCVTCAPRITNSGAPLWVFGYKTEGPSNIVNSLGNATTNEIIGGFFFTAPGSDATIPSTTCAGSAATTASSSATPAMYILASGSKVEASFIEEVEPSSSQSVATQSYPFYVYAAGNCQAGAGSSGNSPFSGAIQRTPIYTDIYESGFIIPQLLAAP